MQFLLFRHADKEKSYADDPPLSSRGARQALGLKDLVLKRQLVAPTLLMSSPKTRAQQTFLPLAEALGLRLQLSTDLLERQSHESSTQFIQRVKSTLSKLEKMTGVVFAVTHYDWIEDFLALVPSDINLNEGQYHSWPPGQFMDFEVKDGIWIFNKMESVSL